MDMRAGQQRNAGAAPLACPPADAIGMVDEATAVVQATPAESLPYSRAMFAGGT